MNSRIRGRFWKLNSLQLRSEILEIKLDLYWDFESDSQHKVNFFGIFTLRVKFYLLRFSIQNRLRSWDFGPIENLRFWIYWEFEILDRLRIWDFPLTSEVPLGPLCSGCQHSPFFQQFSTAGTIGYHGGKGFRVQILGKELSCGSNKFSIFNSILFCGRQGFYSARSK